MVHVMRKEEVRLENEAVLAMSACAPPNLQAESIRNIHNPGVSR